MNPEPLLSKGGLILHFDMIQWKEYDSNGNIKRNMGNYPSYFFIEKNIKTMKTPALVSAISAAGDSYFAYKNDRKKKLNVRYTDAEFWKITDLVFTTGRPFNNKEFNEGQPYAVLDEQTALFYFNTNNPINQTITLNNNNYKVIGVIKNVDVTKFRIAGNVYIPISTNTIFQSKSIFSGHCYALVYSKSGKDTKKIKDEFRDVIANFDYSNANGCNAMETTIDKSTLSGELFYTFFYLFSLNTRRLYYFGISLIILLFLILPALNLININLHRVNERISEIGIRKAFGATSTKLLFQILIETILFTLSGAVIAFLISGFILYLINKSNLFPGTNFNINVLAFINSILSVFVFGVISGVIPAWKMSRKQIISSLNI